MTIERDRPIAIRDCPTTHFQLRLKAPDGMKGTRIAFLREVSDPSQTREVFVEMVEQARQQ